jgi:hypothetical protein
MSLETTGILKVKFETQQKTETFQAREFVIETPGDYPQLVKFQLAQDRCQSLDPFNEGDEMKVLFDLRGREWEGKYFTNLNAWKLEKVGTPNGQQPIKPQEPATNFQGEALGDLPF